MGRERRSTQTSKTVAPVGLSPAKVKAPGELPKGKLAILTDPRIFQESLPTISPPYKRFVGLDLASSCGITFADVMPGQPVKNVTMYGGQWDLSIGTNDSGPIRYIRFKAFLEATQPDLVFYEEVRHTGQAPMAFGGKKPNFSEMIARAVAGSFITHNLMGTLATWCEENGVPCEAIPIGTIKKYGAGSGNANKVDMIKACNERYGTQLDAETYEKTGADNVADSMFLCAMAVQNYAEGMK